MHVAIRRMLCLASCVVVWSSVASARAQEQRRGAADRTEGGQMDTDFGVLQMAEWWYFNGDLELSGRDGQRRLSVLLAGSHMESRLYQVGGVPASYLNRFRGLYFEDGTTRFDFKYTFVPRATIADFVALGTPYLRFRYPDQAAQLAGSARAGYRLRYDTPDVQMDLRFSPTADKTLEQAGAPLRFTTHVYARGRIHGTVTVDGRTYRARGAGYFDHMIPLGSDRRFWAQTMHGWSWSEVTTPDYQAVIYAVRSLEQGYAGYTYKHLTLLDRCTGRVIAEYSGDDVAVIESDWVEEPAQRRRRPLTTVYAAGDVRVTVRGEQTIRFDTADPATLTGFVDFMSHEWETSTIERGSQTQGGDGFFEYLVTEAGAAAHP